MTSPKLKSKVPIYLTIELRQKYNKEKKRFLKVAEPNSLSDVED